MPETLTHNPQGDRGPSFGPLAHVVSVRVLLAVWASLVLLTVATVAVTYIDLGTYNIWLALFIALIKASMVGLYFMHLRWDNPLYAIILFVALLFVVLFIGITVKDSVAYQPNLSPPAGSRVVS